MANPEGQQTPRRSRVKIVLTVGAVIAGVLALVVATSMWLTSGRSPLPTFKNESPKPGAAAAPSVPLDIKLPTLGKSIKLGVIVTYGEETEGSEWLQPAQGAAVAAYRLHMGNAPVELVTLNDRGTEAGARQAVEQMKAEGVEGIVMASSGSHVQGAVTAAKEYHIPMIEVYDNVGTGDGVWSFAPNAEASLVALQSGVEDPNKVVAVEAQGYSTGILAAHTLTYKPGDDPAALARTVAEKTAELGPGTTVTVAAPAAMQASIVKALQEAAVKTTILLSPQAISPVFSTELVKQGGAISSSLATSGVDTSDSVALQSTDEGRSMSTFLKAVGIMSADPNVQTLSGDQEFSTVAAYADSRSHDAVVALAYASALNLDMNNESVLKTLTTVKMRSGEGLAGPALDFTRPNAVTAQPALLHASEQSLGLRPQTAGSAADASITWFAG